MLQWLAYEDLLTLPEADRGDVWIQYVEGGLDVPEYPEPLALYRKLKRFGLSLYSGGYLAQPHLFLLEQEVVMQADSEYQLQQVAKQLLKQAKTDGQTN